MTPPLPYGSRMKVALRDCRFYGHHGVMEQEQVAGNEFSVSLEVVYTPGETISDDIEKTISYADLYEIVKEEMEAPRKLLETVAASITDRICRRWPQVTRADVAITKITPPIPGITGSATVTFSRFI